MDFLIDFLFLFLLVLELKVFIPQINTTIHKRSVNLFSDKISYVILSFFNLFKSIGSSIVLKCSNVLFYPFTMWRDSWRDKYKEIGGKIWIFFKSMSLSFLTHSWKMLKYSISDKWNIILCKYSGIDFNVQHYKFQHTIDPRLPDTH